MRKFLIALGFTAACVVPAQADFLNGGVTPVMDGEEISLVILGSDHE